MEGYFGQVMLFAGYFAPRNWMFCDGQMMDIAQNPALYSILGTTYGGDGVHTFKLPDTKARDAEGMRHVICVNGIYPSRW